MSQLTSVTKVQDAIVKSRTKCLFDVTESHLRSQTYYKMQSILFELSLFRLAVRDKVSFTHSDNIKTSKQQHMPECGTSERNLSLFDTLEATSSRLRAHNFWQNTAQQTCTERPHFVDDTLKYMQHS